MDGPMDKPMDRKRDEEREDHVRCIIVTCVAANGTEDVLLTRYFDGSTPAAQVDIEAQVWEATRHDLQCISEDEQQMVALIENRMIVFTRLADMCLYIVGCASSDELVLSELLCSFVADVPGFGGVVCCAGGGSEQGLIGFGQVLRNLMPKGPSSSQVLIEYAKVHLALDDMVVAAGHRPDSDGGGFVDVLDPGRLAMMAALK